MTELYEVWLIAAVCWATGFISAGVLIDARRDNEGEQE
jgi:hypothetical protein